MCITYIPPDLNDKELIEGIVLLNQLMKRYLSLKAQLDALEGKTPEVGKPSDQVITSLDQVLTLVTAYVPPIKHIESVLNKSKISSNKLDRIKLLIAEVDQISNKEPKA